MISLSILSEKYMLPCLNKKLFGIDCLGCGMQRSLSLLMEGDFKAAFYMYPAIYPLIALFLFLILSFFISFSKEKPIKIGLITLFLVVAIVNYGIKMKLFT